MSQPAAKRLDDPALRVTKTLSAELADRLCDRTRSHGLTPGTRLGTEADQSSEFGVSRPVCKRSKRSSRRWMH
jgi:GntR family transcriptional regulator, transcriptional repressor for pyruvate dehydrogenase complex